MDQFLRPWPWYLRCPQHFIYTEGDNYPSVEVVRTCFTSGPAIHRCGSAWNGFADDYKVIGASAIILHQPVAACYQRWVTYGPTESLFQTITISRSLSFVSFR